jgi:hypothetical protein
VNPKVTADNAWAWYDTKFKNNPMDTETMSLLQTVCAAGGARAAFNGDANARLEHLVEEGLLDVATLNSHRSFYRPTKKGVTMAQSLTLAEAASFASVG